MIFVARQASGSSRSNDPFRIGERNIRATLDYLQQYGYGVGGSQTGGSINRTLHLEISTGTLMLKTGTNEQRFTLGD